MFVAVMMLMIVVMAAGTAFALFMIMLVTVVVAAGAAFTLFVVMFMAVLVTARATFTVLVIVFMVIMTAGTFAVLFYGRVKQFVVAQNGVRLVFVNTFFDLDHEFVILVVVTFKSEFFTHKVNLYIFKTVYFFQLSFQVCGTVGTVYAGDFEFVGIVFCF